MQCKKEILRENTQTCHYYYILKKKSCTWHNMPQPFRCTNAAVVINVYEFQKDEKQEKEV